MKTKPKKKQLNKNTVYVKPPMRFDVALEKMVPDTDALKTETRESLNRSASAVPPKNRLWSRTLVYIVLSFIVLVVLMILLAGKNTP